MIPLIPYNGICRPVIMLAVIVLNVIVLRQARQRRYYKRLFTVICVGYVGLLLYATFLSRSVYPNYTYRIEFMGSAKQTDSIDSGISGLLEGEAIANSTNTMQRLEATAINLLLLVPLGYLMPLSFDFRERMIKAWQAVLAGSLLSVIIEVVQLITRLGMLDVDDWVFNTLGTAIGYCLYWRFLAKKNR